MYAKNKIKNVVLPSKKLGDGVRRKDGRAVAISDPLDIGLEVLVINNRHFGLIGVAVRGTVEVEVSEVFSLSISAQYFGQNSLLY